MNSVYIIAEIGPNHDGDLGIALEMIDKLAEIGVDAIKFQLVNPDKLYSKDSFKAKYVNGVTPTPMDNEKTTRGIKYFLGGILNFQKGIKQTKTINNLKAPNNIGGTLVFKTSLPATKALPNSAITNSARSICLFDKFISLRRDQG